MESADIAAGYLAAGSFIGTCGEELTTRGLPSECICWDLIRTSRYRKNFSASMVRPSCKKSDQAMPMRRCLRISIRRAQQ